MQISQRLGSAANPGGRADGNRKQRGSRALTAEALAGLNFFCCFLNGKVVP